MMVCGRSEVSSRGEFRRKFISRKICKRTLKKIVEKQKREKAKKPSFPEILKPHVA